MCSSDLPLRNILEAEDHILASNPGDFLGVDKHGRLNLSTNSNSLHEISDGTSRVMTSGQQTLRTWKRIARSVNSEDQTMHTQSCNGKRVGSCIEEVQPDLPSKKLQVSKEDGRINIQMVEAAGQPRQSQ